MVTMLQMLMVLLVVLVVVAEDMLVTLVKVVQFLLQRKVMLVAMD